MTEAVRRNSAHDSVIEIGHHAFPVLARDASVGAGLQVMVTASLRSLRIAVHRNQSERPETVHRFRVGLRRLRSLLSAFRSVLPEAERRALGSRLSALARRYGRARDWDVFLSATVRPMAAALPDEPAIKELQACAAEARQHALPAAVDFGEETREVAKAVETAGWLQAPSPEFAEEWRRDLRGFAGELLARRHRRLRKRLKAVDLDDRAAFHDLRIQAKKTRYPIEMFENLYDEDAVDDYLDRLIAIQDALGHLNDAIEARAMVSELPLSSRSQGLAYGWLAHEIDARRHRFPAAAKKLRKAAPFWEE